MRVRLSLAATLAVFVAAFAVTASTTSAAPTRGTISAPITQAQSGGVLAGAFTITSLATNAAGRLVANGTFTGTFTDATGAVRQITSAASSIVTNASTGGRCRILDLVLGPLHLDLLGLVVDLNQVHLKVTAQPGPGNLLGNLLCGVAHLLDNGNTSGLRNLLDRLNALLAGL